MSGGSPTTAKQYRIEERKRTIYVTSDVPPSEWDAHSLDTIFNVAEAQASSGEKVEDSAQAICRTPSLVETQIVIVEDNTQNPAAATPMDVPAARSPRWSMPPQTQHRRTPVKSGRTPPESPRRSPVQRQQRPRILFYDKNEPYYGFTNFSAHPVVYKGKRYPTSEHLFQSFKFHGHRPNLAEHIRTCSERPSVAFSEARRFQPEVRRDWKQVNIEKMEEALWHKFTQHRDLQAELLATGDAELIEDSDKDAFWGCGADRRGRNELGKALERLRSRLRGSAS